MRCRIDRVGVACAWFAVVIGVFAIALGVTAIVLGGPSDVSDVMSPCRGPYDQDGDGDIDLQDYAVFVACFSGEGDPY